MRRIRRELLTGKLDLVKTYCRKCLELERAGLKSARQQKVEKMLGCANPGQNSVLRAAARASRRRDGRLPLRERALELKLRVFGNTCNLRCYMCAPVNSSSRINELEKIRGGYWLRKMTVPDRHGFFDTDREYDRFIADTLKLLPAVKKIRITGGEPFLLKKHHEFLDAVIRSGHAPHIMLTYDSNMMAFKHGSGQVGAYLRQFKQVTIFVSIDDLGARNDYIRRGSHFETVMSNIETARAMPNIKVAVNCATGILNVGDAVMIAEFFDSLNLETGFGMCLVTKPTFLQARHLPDPLKAQYAQRIRSSRYADRMENILHMLALPRDPAEYATFVEYIHDLDAKRGTNYLDLWPELAPYDMLGENGSGGGKRVRFRPDYPTIHSGTENCAGTCDCSCDRGKNAG